MLNDMSPYVAEYNNRKRFRELGFNDSIEKLDAYTGECLVEIDQIFTKIENDKMKAQMAGG